jgi:hypothetical protein
MTEQPDPQRPVVKMSEWRQFTAETWEDRAYLADLVAQVIAADVLAELQGLPP